MCMLFKALPLLAHFHPGRIHFLHPGLLSTWLHGCRLVPRSPSRICRRSCFHYTDVSTCSCAPRTIATYVSPSEQLIPMLGLTALEHKLKPETTLEKIYFLIEHGFTQSHQLTALVSACALVSLVVLRMLKASLRRYKWISYIPEVLIVVIISTSAFCVLPLLVLRLNVHSSIG
jgi:hypothetical protein